MVETITYTEEAQIGMPEMTMQGLSENWLFKKIGAVHWELITRAFKTPSSKLVDSNGNRLYASFVRITIEGNNSLESINENDCYEIESSIQRFGSDMLFSDVDFKNDNSTFKCKLMTVFSSRKQENENNLQKSSISENIKGIPNVKIIPQHAKEYRLLKKGLINTIQLNEQSLVISNNVLFETIYTINPYYDVNGLSLLYFASYPTISDYGESLYFLNKPGYENWPREFYTKSRDVFYYANCNPTDKILYQLHSFEFINENEVKLQSSLLREKDGELMAKIFTIKKRKK